MIGVVDYEAGNIASVSNALSSIGAQFIVSSDSEKLARCDGIILPGVGAAPGAMSSLETLGLVRFVQTLGVPVLGICLGMQLLYQASEEGGMRCLGLLPGLIRSLKGRVSKVPHMGWNRVEFLTRNPLAAGIGSDGYFYFAHSYAADIDESTIATSNCGVQFAAAISKANYFGVQFHPEKSGRAGLSLLSNFDKLCRSFRQ